MRKNTVDARHKLADLPYFRRYITICPLSNAEKKIIHMECNYCAKKIRGSDAFSMKTAISNPKYSRIYSFFRNY